MKNTYIIACHGFFWGVLFFLLHLVSVYGELVFASNRIQDNIVHDNGTWDTNAYNADPKLPTTSTIYILASDGFVLERWKPISGFLDSSDFKQLLTFTEIQTIRTNSQQDWRIYSLPITNDTQTLGVITVSIYHPSTEVLSSFDPQLKQTAQLLSDYITIDDGIFLIKDFDERKIPHYISFQIVNKFNKIVLKGNNSNSIDRLPNFIDPSYVDAQLKASQTKIVRDQQNGNFFLTYSQPLKDENQVTKGVIVVGENLSFITKSFFLYVSFVLGLLVLIFFLKIISNLTTSKINKKKKIKLVFDEKNSRIVVNDIKIPIAYASNQYYLCAAIFQNPHKRWETDELLEKFGDQPKKDSWRKIYDAMNQVNKKVSSVLHTKLIILEEKTYRFNPELL